MYKVISGTTKKLILYSVKIQHECQTEEKPFELIQTMILQVMLILMQLYILI